jgi:hypothetical protein
LWAFGAIYGVWNSYHFGKQNFCVMSIYRHLAGGYSAAQRRFDLIYCCTTAWAIMAMPFVHLAANYFRIGALRFYPVLAAYSTLAILGAAFMLYREWRTARLCLPRLALILTDGAGMATAMVWPLGGVAIVSINHWLVAIGLAGHVHANSHERQPYLFSLAVIVAGITLFCLLFVDLKNLTMPMQFAATAVAFRLALGNVHFLYDRWVWKFSNSEVRRTIGRDLFGPPTHLRLVA